MSVAAFLTELRRRDVRVWLDGSRLRCDAPAGVLTPELQDQLRLRKDDVMDFLRSAEALAQRQRAIVPLCRGGARNAIFGVAGHNGDVFCYRALARHLGEDQPFYGLEPPGLDGDSEPLRRVEDLAAYFAAQISAFQPAGPYVIAGYCAGGTIAFELARQLWQAGAAVGYVALFGSPYAGWYRRPMQFAQGAAWQIGRVGRLWRELAARSGKERRRYLAERLFKPRSQAAESAGVATDAELHARRKRLEDATLDALRRYRPPPFPGRVGLFLPSRKWRLLGGAAQRWRTVAARADVDYGPEDCDGFSMLLEPHAPVFAELLRNRLDAPSTSPGGSLHMD